jgi:hypothetical protein
MSDDESHPENQMGRKDYAAELERAHARENKQREKELERRRLEAEERRQEEERQNAQTDRAIKKHERDEKALDYKIQIKKLNRDEDKKSKELTRERERQCELQALLKKRLHADLKSKHENELSDVQRHIRDLEDDIRNIRSALDDLHELKLKVDYASDEDWAKACMADLEDGIGKDLVSKPKRRCQRVLIPKRRDPSPQELSFDRDWDSRSMDSDSPSCQPRVGGGGAGGGGGAAGAAQKAADDAAPDDDSQRTMDERAQGEPDDSQRTMYERAKEQAAEEDSQRTTDEEEGLQPAPVPVARARLEYAGPERYKHDFPEIPLDEKGTTLGRVPDKNVVVLEHNDQLGMVSRVHLRIEYDSAKGQWTMNEHGKPGNGTLIKTDNMKFPVRVQEWTLKNGDVITVGGAMSTAMRGTPLPQAPKSIYVFRFKT